MLVLNKKVVHCTYHLAGPTLNDEEYRRILIHISKLKLKCICAKCTSDKWNKTIEESTKLVMKELTKK